MRSLSWSERAAALRIALRDPSAYRLYRKYRDSTMVPLPIFADNLALVTSVGVSEFDWVVECGTWRGGVSAAMIEVTRGVAQYAFFDSFKGLPSAGPLDGRSAHEWQRRTDGDWYFNNCTASRAEFERTLDMVSRPQATIQIFEGWFEETVPRFQESSIAVLRLDGDWFDSTMVCLQNLFPRVRPGGLVILDDYGVWAGCNLAVHRYLSDLGRPEHVQRSGNANVAYIIKQ